MGREIESRQGIGVHFKKVRTLKSIHEPASGGRQVLYSWPISSSAQARGCPRSGSYGPPRLLIFLSPATLFSRQTFKMLIRMQKHRNLGAECMFICMQLDKKSMGVRSADMARLT
jgi:hypothetical protein